MIIYDPTYLDVQIYAFFQDMKKINWQTQTSYSLNGFIDECLVQALEFSHEDLDGKVNVPDNFLQEFYCIEGGKFSFDPDDSVVKFFQEFCSWVESFDCAEGQVSNEGLLELSILKSHFSALILEAPKQNSLQMLNETMRLCRDFIEPYEVLHDPADAPYSEHGEFVHETPYNEFGI